MINDEISTFERKPASTEMPDAVTVWAEMDGVMQIVGERVRHRNGKLKMKWKFRQEVLADKIMYLQPC